MEISVVIIGRNCEKLLTKNYINRPHTELSFAKEIIYVDSNSQDNSINIAKQLNWKVISLSPASRLSAAAGRNIGAKYAVGDYILFMDCDMVLNLKENITINGLIEKHIKGTTVGIGGLTLDIFENGDERLRLKRNNDGEKSDTFGGFVLLSRKALLEIGNWNPNVIANEENELYARLLKNNYNVVLSREMHNEHYTDNPKLSIQLLNLYLPLTSKAKKFYGAPGMGLKSAIKHGSAFQYLYYFNSETILSFIIFLLSIVTLLIKVSLVFKFLIILFLLFFLIFWTLKKRSIFFLLLCPSYFMQLVIGYFRYEDKEVIYKVLN
ncbi:glycosyltransferase [Lacinutrix algicola]|uniref:glycosyltransferase n=1 Tax=Lacinutrix algicola TaxID=342954 RepID=UPI0006E44DA0|nr:glycosyltransferase [Lacinutrix algicola]